MYTTIFSCSRISQLIIITIIKLFVLHRKSVQIAYKTQKFRLKYVHNIYKKKKLPTRRKSR